MTVNGLIKKLEDVKEKFGGSARVMIDMTDPDEIGGCEASLVSVGIGFSLHRNEDSSISTTPGEVVLVPSKKRRYH